MIEDTLARIADALERIAASAVPAAAPVEKPAKAKKAEPAPEPALTLDELRKSLNGITPEQARALLAQFEVKKLSELQPEQYADVLQAAKEMR